MENQSRGQIPAPDFAALARALLRRGGPATLATLDPAGAPFASLVATSTSIDGAPILLLSTLSAHTRHLAADPRASLLVAPPAPRGDPLDAARLTISGRVAPQRAEAVRVRHLARNPKARLYAGFADFAFFRLEPESVHFNGGFGRAAPLKLPDVTGPPAPALERAEAAILAELSGAPERPAALAGAPATRGWKAVGIDAFGLDLLRGRAPARVDFGAPARIPADWLAGLAAAAARVDAPAQRGS